MKHERVQLASKLDLEWLDGEIAPLYSDKGRPAIKTPLGQKNRNCRKEVSFHSRRCITNTSGFKFSARTGLAYLKCSLWSMCCASLTAINRG